MTHKLTRLTAVVLALSAGSLLALSSAQTPANVDIDKLGEEAGKKDWAELTKQGAEFAKKHDIPEVMALFKLRKKADEKGNTGGAGVGPTQGAIKPDGIEAKIINMSKNAAAPMKLEQEKAALLQLAQRVSAIAAVTVHQCPVDKKMGDKDPALWKKWMQEMHDLSNDLAKELKKDKPSPEKVRDQMEKLRANCTECHGTFRDAPAN